MSNKKYEKGVTLVEVLLYLGLLVVFITAAVGLYGSTVTAETRNRAANEVEDQGMLILNRIRSELGSAETISAPATGSSGSTLTFSKYNGDQIEFTLSGNDATISRNSGTPVVINSSSVSVNSLTFTDNSSGTPNHVNIELSVSHANPSVPEKEYSADLRTGFTLKSQ